MQRPNDLGLILCHRIFVDRDTGERVFVTFDALRADTIPYTAPPIIAYAALTDGQGEMALDLHVTDIDGEDVLAVESLIVEFPHQLAIAHVSFRFRELSFPVGGQYLFELFADAVSICHRRLHIRTNEE